MEGWDSEEPFVCDRPTDTFMEKSSFHIRLKPEHIEALAKGGCVTAVVNSEYRIFITVKDDDAG